MTQKMSKTRQNLIESYIESLNENQIPWIKDWSNCSIPRNAISNNYYNGINRMYLNYVASIKEYKDPRWCTFNQIADKDGKYHKNQKWHLKKDSKGVPIEFYFIYDRENKVKYDIAEYKKLVAENPELADQCTLSCRTYTVFNGSQIEGIPDYVPEVNNVDIDRDVFLDNVINNMNIKFKEFGNKAFYSLQKDTVTVPPKETFSNKYSYHATALHELSHATGHPSRLNRDMSGCFGSERYAKEELRAEIGASFVMQDLNINYDQKHIDNHKAYIQSWIGVLKNNPDELFKAIADANKIADFIKEKGERTIEHEINFALKEQKVDNRPKNIKERIAIAKAKAANQPQHKAIRTKNHNIER